jgi:PAS domain S-box-containing protein
LIWPEGDDLGVRLRDAVQRVRERASATGDGELSGAAETIATAAQQAEEVARRDRVYRDTIRRQNREFERKLQEMSILRKIGDLIAASLKTDDLLERLLDVLVEELHVDNSSVMLLDAQSGDLRVEAGRGPGAPDGGRPGGGPALRSGEGIAGWVAASREPLIVPDVSRDVRFRHAGGEGAPKGALVCVPLVAEDNVLGVLNLSSDQRSYFDSHHVHILMIVAAQIAGALTGRMLYSDLKRLSARLEEEIAERTGELRRRTADLRRKNEQVTELYTSLESAQRELEQRNRRLVESLTFNDNIVETIHVGISVVSRDGRVATWNRAMEAITGGEITKAMVLGKRIDVVPDEVRARFALGRDMESALEQGHPRVLHNHVAETADGRRHLNVHHLPVAVSPSDRDGHVITVVEDVTGNVALHEQKVRSARLAAITETVVSVNHEVNNPLAVILGYVQMLLRRSVQAGDDASRLEWIRRAVTDLERIEAEVLRIGRITRKLSSLIDPVVTSYPAGEGVRMVDLNQSR